MNLARHCLLPTLFLVLHTASYNGSQAKSFFEPASDADLSPDTFKRLAAALYQRGGDKVENRLTRKFLYNRNVTCNDGSPSGYYIRRNRSSTRWVIFLEGGWFCYDRPSCEARWLRLRTLMSSDHWPTVKTAGGILSADAEENPHFADANHVLVPYCTSDSWTGTAASEAVSSGRHGHRTSSQYYYNTNNQNGGSRFSFLGAMIVKEVIRELFSWEQLGSGQELYLAGSSAGGTGVLVNLDQVADLVQQLGGHMRVRGIVDSGWFLDNDPYIERADGSDNQRNQRNVAVTSGGSQTSASSTLRRGVEMWRASLPDGCREQYPDQQWKCFYGFRIYPTLKTPVFFFQWQFDEAQMTVDNVGTPVSRQQWNYIHHQGKNIRATLESVGAVYSPSCISHTVITKPDWSKVRVGGVSLPSALQCWAETTLPGEQPIEFYRANKYLTIGQSLDDFPAPSNDQLTKNDDDRPLADSPIISSTDVRQSQADFASVRKYKLNSNLVRSIDTNPVPEDYTNSMGHRISKVRHNNNKVRDNRTKKRMKNKHKNGSSSNCGYGSLEKRIKCIQKENRQWILTNEIGANKNIAARTNRDLVRSLDSETSTSDLAEDDKDSDDDVKNLKEKRRHRRRNRRRNRKIHLEGMEGLSKEERRARRKAERRRLRQLEKKRKKMRRRAMKKRLKELKKLRRQQAEEPEASSDSKSRRRRQDNPWRQRRDTMADAGGQCAMKHVDNCSWPQCNRSCPKLHNPLTGEEMDFLELLESFGLDMQNVAKALGIQLTDLHHMDPDILLHLLTSHSSNINN